MSDVEVIILNEEYAGANTTRYEVGLIAKGHEGVQKASAQADPAEATLGGTSWVEPRLSFSDLLYFYDVNVWHRRCVDLKALLTGSMGWELVAVEDEEAEPDEMYERIAALLSNPQSERPAGELRQPLGELLECFLIDFGATGNAFLEVPRNGKGEVAEIYHARAATIRRARDTKEGYHQLQLGQSKVRFSGWGERSDRGQNEVLHFLQYDPQSDYYGMPTWLPALGAMMLDRTAVEYNTYLFRNGLVAHFVVVVEGGKLGKTQIEALKTFIRENATGIQNAGRGLVLQNDKEGVKIRIEKLNVDFKDLQFGEGRKLSRDEVASAHGVPPRLLGIMQAGQLGGGSEVEGQLKVFFDTVIRPSQRRLEAFLNSTIIQSFYGEAPATWRLRLKGINTATSPAQIEALSKLIDAGFDPASALKALEMPPIAMADATSA